MKTLLLAVMLVAGAAQAQLVPGNGDGHGPGSGNNPCKYNQCGNNGGHSHEPGHHGGNNNGGHLVPGNGNGHGPGPSYPSNPYQPGPSYPNYPNNPYQPGPSYPSNPYPSNPYPSYPGYSDYGPAYTYRWLDMGINKVDKFFTESIRINAGNRLVNEVLLRSYEGDTSVVRAYATLASGRVISLQTGVIRQGSEVRLRLDYQSSLRIQQIEIQATSQNLIGSRARLQIWLGLAE